MDGDFCRPSFDMTTSDMTTSRCADDDGVLLVRLLPEEGRLGFDLSPGAGDACLRMAEEVNADGALVGHAREHRLVARFDRVAAEGAADGVPHGRLRPSGCSAPLTVTARVMFYFISRIVPPDSRPLKIEHRIFVDATV